MRVCAIVACLAVSGLLAACAANRSGEPPYEQNAVIHQVSDADRAVTQVREPVTSDRVVLYVNGLGCPLCATNIDRQLERLPGVQKVDVDLSVGRVTMEMAGNRRPSPYQISEAVLDAGFTLVKIEQH